MVHPDKPAIIMGSSGETVTFGDRLAHFKCPRTVDFVPELPRSETGKLYKRMLRDAYWAGDHSSIGA
jgi:acyl-coenzyme A synthetase/AMP-(fatty) acid ligase